jgi:four helix bundle protein
MRVKDFKCLKIWTKGMEIVQTTYDLTGNFPINEKYGLISQMQRAAVSIPANISEGFARQHVKEYRQFCYIASGSCAELQTLAYIAEKQGYISSSQLNELLTEILHESKMIMNLIKKL